MKKILPLSLLFLGMMGGARAQTTCGTTITNFPYFENFEGASASNWTSGGTNSSWALGKPAKPIINTAASGTKSWTTSLTGQYNASEQSFVESPCFNFTNIVSPMLELKIWWNSEYSMDGAVLQSSIDGGATWQNVGVKGDPNNWYNDNTINGGPGGQPTGSTSTAQGWTGRALSSNGSNGWVLAKHALTGLGGKPSVKLRIAFGSEANTIYDDGFAFDDVVVFDLPANDAGITSIAAPVSPVVPGNPVPVSVTMKNYGTSPLTAATIMYSVNGVTQAPFPWTGTISPGATSTPIQIGTFTFPAGVQKIKAWSKLPNGATVDGNPSNDSTSLSINSCFPISGNFTINKNAPASATNFLSFSAAAQQLGNCGVNGPVTLTVAPNSGPYNEQVVLPVIPGVSATNTITIEGNGNKLTGTTGTTYVGVFTFNGADFVKINNLKIEVDPAAFPGYGVQLMNASDNNSITNCAISLSTSALTNQYCGIVTGGSSMNASGNFANNLLVQNNIIRGGNYGILLNGVAASAGTPTVGARIINNIIQDANSIGIQMSDGGIGSIIEGNDISRMTRTNGSGFNGIYIVGNCTNTVINKNRIHNTHDAAAATNYDVRAIWVSANATAGNENIIKNNLVYNINNTGGNAYGIYGAANGAHYYHNTIAIDNPGVTFLTLRGIHNHSGNSNVRFVNNIISLTSPATTKYGIYVNITSLALTSNYNNIYVGSTGKIGFYNGEKATLTDWQAANTTSPYDQQSISTDPLFVSATYLQPLAPALNNAGQPVATVTDAINGVTRSTTNPDMGAYEFTPAINDVGVIAINAPTSPVTPGNQPVQVTLKNFGTAALTSATIGWSVNGVAQPNFTYNGSLNSLQTTASPVTIGNYTFPAGNFVLKVWGKNPNGAADQLAANDTTILNIVSCAPLAGAYTINKNNPTAGTNFQSISEAVARLNSCGVSAPVTITVAAGTGPYNEQVEFKNVPYTSATNTVTFEGSGNTVSATPVGKQGIFILNGTKNVKLNNFVITLPTTAAMGWGVQLLNASDNNTISNNIINLPLTSTSTDVNGIVAGLIQGTGGNHASNTKIQNNTINGGYCAVQMMGTANAILTNNQITGNLIKDPVFNGIILGYSNNTLVEGNDISRATRTNGTSFFCIQVNGNSLNNIISKNRIHNTHDAATLKTGTVYGIQLNAPATLGNENIIKNNAIYNINNAGGLFYGFVCNNSDGAYFFHNTIASDPAISYVTLRGINFGGVSYNVKLINNIFNLPSTGTTKHAIFMGNASTTLVTNNNVFNMGAIGNVGYLTNDRTTLANWQAAGTTTNPFDQNSVAVDPVLTSLATGDLKPTAVAVDNLGQPLATVTDDILGAVRNATPDPGAFEFGVPANDVGITSVSVSNANNCTMSATDSVTITIKNYGNTTQTSIPVTYSVNNVAIATSETFTGSLAPNGTATYTFKTKVNLSAAGTYQIIPKTMLGGDIVYSNDTDTISVQNAQVSGMPVVFDFETVTSGFSIMRKVVNSKADIIEHSAASFGGTSTKGLIMTAVDTTNWVTPSVTSTWNTNPDNFAGAYFCFSPGTGAATDSLIMTFDLKQLFKKANGNTNFRVTVNGVQVGPTYRPPFSGTPIVWQKIRVDLTQYKNDPTIQIGLESSVKEAYDNGNGTANLLDNLEIKRVAVQTNTGVKDATLAAQLNVFPNPSNGIFNVELPKGKVYELVVTDLTGKVLVKQTANGTAQLNLEGTAKGIYLLKVSGANGTAVRKLIVE